jgi:outer membrane protein OmpA-like peptidoglycan-associated protein
MRRSGGVLAMLLAAGGVAAQPVGDGDPEPPDAQARAVAALPNARVLDLAPAPPRSIPGLSGDVSGVVKSIVGITSAVGGGSKSVAGKVLGLEAAMKDLDAKVLGREIHIELAADVLFDFDKAELRAEAAVALAKVAVVIRAQPGSRVRVEGHTDSKGDEEYNLNLSQRRAQSVVQWLKQHEGLASTAFEVHGHGETRPVAPNVRPDGSDDPEGRQKNRRVEIVVVRAG